MPYDLILTMDISTLLGTVLGTFWTWCAMDIFGERVALRILPLMLLLLATFPWFVHYSWTYPAYPFQMILWRIATGIHIGSAVSGFLAVATGLSSL